MPKALCGPAFHDNQVTNHTPIQAPCAYLLFTQQNSSPFWHLKVFAHPLAPNYLFSFILTSLLSLLMNPLTVPHLHHTFLFQALVYTFSSHLRPYYLLLW